MRNRLLRRATLGTATTLLAAGAVIGAPGTSSAARSTFGRCGDPDHRGQGRYDRDCDGHSAYPYGGYYGGGLGLLSWLL